MVTDPLVTDKPYGSVYEAGQDTNNTRASDKPLLIDQPPPADLTVGSVVSPQSAMAGSTIQLTWQTINAGVNPAVGSWTDIAYLSTDNVWDINDTPIGTYNFTGPLASGAGYTTPPVNAIVPAALPGTYRIIVRTDVFDTVPELREDNNSGISLGTLQVEVPQLTLGVAQTIVLNSGQDQLFKVVVPQGGTLRVDLTSPDATSSNVLYLRYNDLPSGANYDASYANTLQADQYAVIPSTTAGIYYVLARGEANHAATATLLAQLLPFQITDISPDAGGDSQFVTTTITGAQFDPQAIVKLVRPGYAEYEPVSYKVEDQTRIVAVFDLTDAPHGLYDVEVINPNGDDRAGALPLSGGRHDRARRQRFARRGARHLGRTERAIRLYDHEPQQRRHSLCRFQLWHPHDAQQRRRRLSRHDDKPVRAPPTSLASIGRASLRSPTSMVRR